MTRARIREQGCLLVKDPNKTWVEPTRDNACANEAVLIPCLRRMHASPNQTLPCLPALQVEIGKFFSICGVEPQERQIWRHGCEIKKLLGLVKRKVNRKEYTKDIFAKMVSTYRSMFFCKHARLFCFLTSLDCFEHLPCEGRSLSPVAVGVGPVVGGKLCGGNKRKPYNVSRSYGPPWTSIWIIYQL